MREYLKGLNYTLAWGFNPLEVDWLYDLYHTFKDRTPSKKKIGLCKNKYPSYMFDEKELNIYI